jgi:hypothetical protein
VVDICFLPIEHIIGRSHFPEGIVDVSCDDEDLTVLLRSEVDFYVLLIEFPLLVDIRLVLLRLLPVYFRVEIGILSWLDVDIRFDDD